MILTLTPPTLTEGETYIGPFVFGSKREDVILLPGDCAGLTWGKAMAWAKSIGGDLPDRVEQDLRALDVRHHELRRALANRLLDVRLGRRVDDHIDARNEPAPFER